MTITSAPCRTYIVYEHSLFAQGVRSVLEAQDGVQIVGMEKDIGKALKAVRSLRPAVVLVEEPTGKNEQWPFLQLATAGRVVTLSLDHAFATVYDQCRVPASDPSDLAKAIRGVGKPKRPQVPPQSPPRGKAVMGTRTNVTRDRDKYQSVHGSRVRRVLKEKEKKLQHDPRPPRENEKKKGG